MDFENIKDPLRSWLKAHWNVNCRSDLAAVQRNRQVGESNFDLDVFECQLRELFDADAATIQEYEAMTKLDFDDRSDFLEDVAELWSGLYPEKP